MYKTLKLNPPQQFKRTQTSIGEPIEQDGRLSLLEQGLYLHLSWLEDTFESYDFNILINDIKDSLTRLENMGYIQKNNNTKKLKPQNGLIVVRGSKDK